MIEYCQAQLQLASPVQLELKVERQLKIEHMMISRYLLDSLLGVFWSQRGSFKLEIDHKWSVDSW